MTTKSTRRRPIGSSRIVLMTTMLLAGLCAQAAGAQQPQDSQTAAQPVAVATQPYRGLFGAGSPAAPNGHLLNLTALVSEEYGTNDNSEIPAGSLVLSDGWFTGVRSALAFEKAGRYTRFGLRGEGAFRYYSSTRLTTLPRFQVDMGLDHRTGQTRRDSVSLGGSVAYEPYFTLSIFQSSLPVTGGSAIVPSSRDDLLTRRARYIFGQSFAFEHQLSQHTYVGLFEGVRYTRADTPGLDAGSIRAGARFGYRVSRDAALRLGYAYQTGRYGLDGAQRMTTHDLDVSLDYRKALDRSRRTTIGFGTGSSRVTTQAAPRWIVIATANLRHEMAAGWFIQTDFTRNTQIVEGFANPFSVNTVTASLGGFMGRRVEFLASGGYSRGSVGFGSENYHAVQGSTRLRLALARYLAIDLEGLINQHAFDTRIAIPDSVLPTLNRWAVRCNIALWLPLSR